MKNLRKKVFRHLFGPKGLVVLFCVLIWSCSGYSATGGPGPLVKPLLSVELTRDAEVRKFNTIAVLPFDSLSSSVVPERRMQTLTRALLQAFDVNTSLSILNRSEQGSTEAVLARVGTAGVMSQRAQDVGRKLGAQGVLYGVIGRFSGGEGSKFGSSAPAAVGFKLWLLDVSDGQVVWRATYEHIQRPLSDNLFRVSEAFKDGVMYRNPEELMGMGFKEAAKALERIREDKE